MKTNILFLFPCKQLRAHDLKKIKRNETLGYRTIEQDFHSGFSISTIPQAQTWPRLLKAAGAIFWSLTLKLRTK